MNRAPLLALVLGACSASPVMPRDDSPPLVSNNVAPAEPLGEVPPDNVLVTDPSSLIGTWYEWSPANDPRRRDIVLKIGATRMMANSDCATFAWDHRVVDGRLEIRRAPVSSCARGLTAREERFAKAIEAATIAYHRGGRGLVFEGPRGRIVLSDRPSESR
jgi:hypothetical protein